MSTVVIVAYGGLVFLGFLKTGDTLEVFRGEYVLVLDSGAGPEPERGHEAVGARAFVGWQTDEGDSFCPDQYPG